MYFIYVLLNLDSGRYYTGHTADLTQRVGQHNQGLTKSTKNRGCWELIYKEEFATRAEAMRREKYLKSGKGREELRARLGRPLLVQLTPQETNSPKTKK
jgi:putative endonuclease